MPDKPWRECGDYIKSLPETHAIGVIFLPEGVSYEPFRSIWKEALSSLAPSQVSRSTA